MVRRRALVTGATGGFGRALVPALIAQGYAVRAVGRNADIGAKLVNEGAEFVRADLRSDALDALVNDVDVVFHLAALSSPWGRHSDFVAINITATQRLLDAARTAGCRTFIYASTPSIYVAPYDRFDLTETCPVAAPFANAYAVTKYAAEQRVLAANSPAFVTLALRPRAIVGPHDTVLLPRLLRAAKRGHLPIPNAGRAKIELSDVRDVVRAFIAADAHRLRAAGLAINISGGEPRALRDLLDHIFAHLGRRVRYVPVHMTVALYLAAALEGIAARMPNRPEPPVTRYSLMVLGYAQTFNLQRAHDLLSWCPQHSVEDMIAHALPNGYANA